MLSLVLPRVYHITCVEVKKLLAKFLDYIGSGSLPQGTQRYTEGGNYKLWNLMKSVVR